MEISWARGCGLLPSGPVRAFRAAWVRRPNGLAFGSSRMFGNLLTRRNVTRMVTYVTRWHTCARLRQRHWSGGLGQACSVELGLADADEGDKVLRLLQKLLPDRERGLGSHSGPGAACGFM